MSMYIEGSNISRKQKFTCKYLIGSVRINI